jgi:methyltransferase-like protein
MQAGIFPPHVVETLNQISDSLIAKEQYLDFLKGRRFRQTLLCHRECPLDYTLRPERLAAFSIASPLRPENPEVDLRSRTVTTFVGPKNSSLATDNPVLKAAALTLGKVWPQALPFDKLLTTARAAGGRGETNDFESLTADTQALGDLLLRAYAGNMVEFHVCPPRFVTVPGERPVASPLARLQSREHAVVSNLRHYTTTIDSDVGHHLLQLADGSRDRKGVLDALVALVESGAFTIEREGAPVSDGAEIRKFFAAELERNLADLARHGLLVA